jgi:hypothetical protein
VRTNTAGDEPAHTTFVAIVQRSHVDDAAEKLAPLGERWQQLIEFPKEFGIIAVVAGQPPYIDHCEIDDLPVAIRAVYEYVAGLVPIEHDTPIIWFRCVEPEIDRDIVEPLLVELHAAEGSA